MTDAYATIKVLATQQQRARDPPGRQPGQPPRRRHGRSAASCSASSTASSARSSPRRGAPCARPARRDPDRRRGARGGAEAQLLLEIACRARRRRSRWRDRRPRWRRSAAAGSATRRRALGAPGLSSTTSAPLPPSAARACVKASTSLLCTSQLHLRLEHRLAPGRAVALAVDDAHAAQARCARASRRNAASALARLVAAQAVQVDLALDAPRRRGAACAPRRGRCRGGETTARRRSRAATRRRTRRRSSRAARPPRRAGAAADRRRPRSRRGARAARSAQRHDRADASAKQSRSRARAARVLRARRRARRSARALRCSSSGAGSRASSLEATALQRRRLHSSPRSANETTSPRPTTRWSSTRTSTSASALFSVCVRNSSARDGSAAPDGMVVREDHRRGVELRARA